MSKMKTALICGMLGCLCYGSGDWLMMYGNPTYHGTLSWLTEGVAAMPQAFENPSSQSPGWSGP